MIRLQVRELSYFFTICGALGGFIFGGYNAANNWDPTITTTRYSFTRTTIENGGVTSEARIWSMEDPDDRIETIELEDGNIKTIKVKHAPNLDTEPKIETNEVEGSQLTLVRGSLVGFGVFSTIVGLAAGVMLDIPGAPIFNRRKRN